MPLKPLAQKVLLWLEAVAPCGWYKPEMRGYTEDVTRAGLFDREEAEQHARGRGPDGVEVVVYGGDRMMDILGRGGGLMVRTFELAVELLSVEVERDAALARIRELEARIQGMREGLAQGLNSGDGSYKP